MNKRIAGILATIISGVAVASPTSEVIEHHFSLKCVENCHDIEITLLFFILDKLLMLLEY